MTKNNGSKNLLPEISECSGQYLSLSELMDNPEYRKYACEQSLRLFSLYYFQKFHFFEMPEFHKDFYSDAAFNDKVGALWVTFRESAKTSIAKIAIIHKICYEKKRFVIWVSYDQRKAESNLYDVALELQTNPRLLEDFGQLFYEPDLDNKEERKRFSKKKSIKEFITTNKIKVKAYSTGMSIRGEVHGNYRPDYYVLDDIETSKTVVSEQRTLQVTEFFDEMISGASGDANFLILANRLSFSGSIAYIEDKINEDKEWVIRDIPIIDGRGMITWPSKYVYTDKEAEEINSKLVENGIRDKKQHVVSLERKRRQMGSTTYNREMMNTPLTDEEREIKLPWLQHTFIENAIKDRARNRYATIDVADSKARGKNDPDYTGTTVVDIDVEGNWYVQFVKNRRMNAPELIDWIFYIWVTYKPIKIGIEKKSLEDQVIPYIRAKSEEKQIYPVVVELKHGGTRKEDRIRGSLQGRLEAGKIRFKKDATDDTDELKKQLFDFPKSKKDDLCDSLAYVEQIGARPFVITKETFVSELHREFWENKRRQNKPVSVKGRLLRL